MDAMEENDDAGGSGWVDEEWNDDDELEYVVKYPDGEEEGRYDSEDEAYLALEKVDDSARENLRITAGEGVSWDEIAQDVQAEFDEEFNEKTGTKYEAYQVPGGKEYRELLLTLPAPEPPGRVGVRDSYGQWMGYRATEELARRDAEAVGGTVAYKVSPSDRGEEYRSNHWDEPNVLAHVRFNERTDADGKRVLFLEEVQSDFGQDTRKSKLQVIREVKADFNGIVERMKQAGVLEVNCD
jgi:hypothetical protein